MPCDKPIKSSESSLSPTPSLSQSKSNDPDPPTAETFISPELLLLQIRFVGIPFAKISSGSTMVNEVSLIQPFASTTEIVYVPGPRFAREVEFPPGSLNPELVLDQLQLFGKNPPETVTEMLPSSSPKQVTSV